MNKSDRIGIVLSGGGGKGAYQIGAWQAICELGWNTGIIAASGASVGALNAALIACCDVEEAKALWKSISPLQFLDVDLPITDGIFSREGLTNLINRNLNLDKIRQGSMQVYANTTRINADGSKQPCYFLLNTIFPADILQILLASSAIPLAYPSVSISGLSHEDGGVTDNLPIQPLYDAGIRSFILVDISEDTPFYEAFWPGAEFIHIRPSGDIGHLLDGTLDFTAKGASFRLDLGYRDALRTLRAYEAGKLNDPLYSEINRIEADSDYAAAKVDALSSQLQSSVDEQFGNIDRLLKKFGI